MSEPPRFNSTASRPTRPSARLVVAIGILATAGIATGGLASVLSRETPPEPESGPGVGLVRQSAKGDPRIELELRVREAEAAAARARAALRDATLDREERDAFERRLEQLGMGPLESVRRDYAPEPDFDEFEQAERQPHLHAIASPSREL
jgi:hypothetical protein